MPSTLLPIDIPWGQRKPPYGTRVNRKDPIGKSVVGCWLLNEGAGGMAYDASGHGNNGTLNGGVTWSGGDLQFNGGSSGATTAYVSVPNAASLNFTSQITVRARIYLFTLNTGNGQRIVAKWDGSHSWILEQANNSTFKFWINNGSTSTNAAFSATAGVWWDLLGTFDGSNIKIYGNGVLKATTALSGAISTNTHPVYFGAGENLSNNQFLNGIIRDSQILPIALSASQILSLYTDPYCYLEPRTLWLPSGGAVTPPPSTIVQRRIPGPTRVGSRRAA
ncbi:MAG: LamG domain-containing protein [Patescibacteria group bacterium]|nr:LamG domain-containing protein [Patescibacteria group bacterium]